LRDIKKRKNRWEGLDYYNQMETLKGFADKYKNQNQKNLVFIISSKTFYWKFQNEDEISASIDINAKKLVRIAYVEK